MHSIEPKINLNLLLISITEAYSEPIRTSKMELLAKIESNEDSKSLFERCREPKKSGDNAVASLLLRLSQA